MGLMYPVQISLGIMAAYVIGYPFKSEPTYDKPGTPSDYWRFVFAFPIIIMVARLLFF